MIFYILCQNVNCVVSDNFIRWLNLVGYGLKYIIFIVIGDNFYFLGLF